MDKKFKKTELIIDNPNKKVKEALNTYCELVSLAGKLNYGEQINWNDINQYKYYIYYSYCPKGNLQQGWETDCKSLNNIYCLDSNFLKKAKEIIGEKRLEKLFKEE